MITLDIVAQTVTQTAVDQGYATLICKASNQYDREVVSCGYTKGTNTTNAFPMYLMIAPQPATEADGTYLISTGATTSPVIGYPIAAGPSTANSDDSLYMVWPSRAKSNLSGRWILPAGWAIVSQPLDADMDGTIIHYVITREIPGDD